MKISISICNTIILFIILSISEFAYASNMQHDEQIVINEDILFEQLSHLSDYDIYINESFISYIASTNQHIIGLLSNHQLEEAEKILSTVTNKLSKYPKLAPYQRIFYSSYGMLYMNLKNYETAEFYLNGLFEFMDEYSIPKNESYAECLSLMAVCHAELFDFDKAFNEIKEAISIIENLNLKNEADLLFPVYQKASTIYKKYGSNVMANSYTLKAFNLLDEEDNSPAAIYTINNLAVDYLNEGNYSEAIKMLKLLETKKLTEIEKATIYENLFMASYFTNNEEECIKYARLSSEKRMNYSQQLYSSIPVTAQDKLWIENSISLLGNISVLSKFHNNQSAVELCYDIILLVKSLSVNHMSSIHHLSKTDSIISSKLHEVNYLKSIIFSGYLNDNQIQMAKEKIFNTEKELINRINTYSFAQSWVKVPSWLDVKSALKKDEYAVEFIVYGNYAQKNEDSSLRYAGLIISPNNDSPIFVDLCSANEIEVLYNKSINDPENGINLLYTLNNDNSLYQLVWEKIEHYIPLGATVFISPYKHIQKFNLSFMPCPDSCYLSERYNIRTLTSTGNICNPTKGFDIIKEAFIYGGVNYNEQEIKHDSSLKSLIIEETVESLRDGVGYLPYSEQEADTIAEILNKNNCIVSLFKGSSANEESFISMDGNSPSLIHIASHTFNVDSFGKSDKVLSYLGQFKTAFSIYDYSMILSGLLFADAKSTLDIISDNEFFNDGIVTAEEISFLDLSNTRLAVISACGSGEGWAMQEGYGGIVKAFKLAGVEQLLVSLWPVFDDATSLLMSKFYKYLLSGEEIHLALLKAQHDTALFYPDPYYWAAFILLD